MQAQKIKDLLVSGHKAIGMSALVRRTQNVATAELHGICHREARAVLVVITCSFSNYVSEKTVHELSVVS
jgi:hypothetical protein